MAGTRFARVWLWCSGILSYVSGRMIDMSKWTDIRDSIEQAVSDTQIDEQVKQAVTQQCYDMILPSLRKLGDGFVDAIKAQSADESGWCKVRDAIVLPALIEGSLWLVELVLKKTIEKTTASSTVAV